MPSATLAINHCSYLPLGSKTPCGKKSIAKFCGYHNRVAKQGSVTGPQPCLRCGIVIRGKLQLCVGCGSHRYRSIVEYCRRVNKPIPALDEFLRGTSTS